MWRINREAVLLGAGPAATAAPGRASAHRGGRRAAQRFPGRTPSDGCGAPSPRPWTWCSATDPRPSGRSGGSTASTPSVAGRRDRSGRRPRSPARTTTGRSTRSCCCGSRRRSSSTSVRAYRRWVGPLTHDRTWRHSGRRHGRSGVRMGIPLRVSPADWSALMAYWRPDAGTRWPDPGHRYRPRCWPRCWCALPCRSRPAGPSTCWRCRASRCCRTGSGTRTASRGVSGTRDAAAIIGPGRPALDGDRPGRVALDAPGARCGPTGRGSGRAPA